MTVNVLIFGFAQVWNINNFNKPDNATIWLRQYDLNGNLTTQFSLQQNISIYNTGCDCIKFNATEVLLRYPELRTLPTYKIAIVGIGKTKFDIETGFFEILRLQNDGPKRWRKYSYDSTSQYDQSNSGYNYSPSYGQGYKPSYQQLDQSDSDYNYSPSYGQVPSYNSNPFYGPENKQNLISLPIDFSRHINIFGMSRTIQTSNGTYLVQTPINGFTNIVSQANFTFDISRSFGQTENVDIYLGNREIGDDQIIQLYANFCPKTSKMILVKMSDIMKNSSKIITSDEYFLTIVGLKSNLKTRSGKFGIIMNAPPIYYASATIKTNAAISTSISKVGILIMVLISSLLV